MSPQNWAAMIQRVLGIIAGVDRKTLQSCPASDKLWATHLGASLCLSFVVVLGVSFHATGYMIDNIWTRLLVSTVIALTVLMFDRALCQSDWFYQGTLWNTSAIQSRAEAKQTAWRFVRVGIRLTLSFGLAWVIAMFLELAIFSSTINEKIEADRVVANQPVYDKIAAFEAGLNAEAKRRLADIEQLEALHRDALTEQPKPEPTTQARTEDIEQQIRALATREAGIRADIAEIDKTIQRYIADMNAEEFGLKATPNNSGRPGAGPRYEFARKQRQAFLAQRAEREAEIAQLHIRRDDLRAAQAKITTDALAAREQERVAIKARADALQQRIDAARADLKQFEVDKAASVADFRKKVMSDSYFQEKKDKFDPLTRIAAYQELKNDPRDGATMTLFSWMTRCFIIFLEIVPVVAKIFFSPPSVYAAKIQAQVERARQRIENNEDLDDEAPKPAPAPAMAAITLPAMALDPVTVAQPQAQAPKPQAAPAPEPARAAEPPPAPPRPLETARGFEHALHDDEADYDEMRRRDDRRAYEWRRYGGRDSDGGYDDYDPREFERREFARRHDYDRYDERPRRAAARRSPPQFVARDYAIRDYGGRDFGEPEYETSEIDVRNLIMPRRGSARREAYAVEPTARVRVPADDRGPARSAGLEPVAERSLRWPDGIPVDDLNTRELVRQVLADAGTAARAEPIRSEPAQAETTARVEPIRPVEPSPAEPAPSEPAMIEPAVSEAVATEPAATAFVADPATSTPEPEAVLTVVEAMPVPPQALEPDVLPNVLTRTRAVPAEQPTPSPQATASDEAAIAGVVHPEEIGPLPKFSADVEKLMTDAVELSRPRKKAAHPRREHHTEGEAELPLEHKVRHETPPQA
ncbi:DUF4407 domain-containing protein [Rhodopseudomonas palustris]|uniref:DUF4407 domain-containing protein n=1 Tax=Rhodopseudomonas palustris TaxID=1076 RepID=UPI000E5B1D80|nr:DUF4407 domain-containing protein [Rhodopseudomonas palustris]QLH71310.1 DUF4407 domain-containing protein [Rhodopseudomonas palustris]RHZ93625.1 DUF4407 domain-containing protein [Rhodopseudomonas palustris]